MTTLPISPPPLFWAAATLTGIALLSALIFGLMFPPGSDQIAPLERLQRAMRSTACTPECSLSSR